MVVHTHRTTKQTQMYARHILKDRKNGFYTNRTPNNVSLFVFQRWHRMHVNDYWLLSEQILMGAWKSSDRGKKPTLPVADICCSCCFLIGILMPPLHFAQQILYFIQKCRLFIWCVLYPYTQDSTIFNAFDSTNCNKEYFSRILWMSKHFHPSAHTLQPVSTNNVQLSCCTSISYPWDRSPSAYRICFI